VDDCPHIVFAHACRLGAVGIVSKKIDYRSGPCRVWIKLRSPASIAAQRERSEKWNRRSYLQWDSVATCAVQSFSRTKKLEKLEQFLEVSTVELIVAIQYHAPGV
jgi:hypothetical protein